MLRCSTLTGQRHRRLIDEGMTSASAVPARLALPSFARAALVGFGTMILVWACVSFAHDHDRVSPLWLANAFVLTWLLRSEIRAWPLLALAAAAGNLAGNFAAGDAAPVAAALTVSNLAEYLICAAVLRGRLGADFDLTRRPHLFWFLAVCGVAGPLVSSLLAASLLGLLNGAGFIGTLVRWALSDSLGLTILTPCLLTLAQAPALLKERPATPRALAMLAGAAALVAVVFAQTRYPVLFLVPPALLFVTLELEMLGAVTIVLATAAIAVFATVSGHGPLALVPGDMTARVTLLQVFLAACVLACTPVASLTTQRRRLRQSLQAALGEAELNARRAHLAEQVAGVGYWSADLVSQKTFWSEEMYRMFGLPVQAEPDRRLALAMVHPEDLPAHMANFERAFRTGEGWDNDLNRVTLADGSMRYLKGRAVAETDGRGRTIGLFGTVTDVTLQVGHEQELAHSEARYRMLAENATDLVIKTDLEGKVLYVSPSALAVTGYTREELTCGLWHDRFHADDVQRMIEVRADAIAHRRPSGRVEYRLVRKDGRVAWLEGRPALVFDPATGEPRAITDVLRDVTERKALEAELRQARTAAEAAAAVKSDFMANMSHELRTPLTAVLGFSNLLAEQPELGPDARRYVGRVSSASKALLSTVNDILDFSKLEAGQVEIKRAPASPVAVAREAVDVLSAQAEAKGLTLELAGEDALPARVEVDADRVRQVLLNLIGNAVKFTDRGGVRLEAGYDPATERLSFTVADTGPGLSEEQQARLFQRFSQVDASSTRRHGGTGLGLAICKGLVEAMGGEIGVTSREGGGARFWLWIAAPAAMDPGLAGVAPADLAGLPPGCRVLIADDNPVNRELAKAMLSPFEVQVAEARDGLEAVAQAMAMPFDVILMDLRMPGLDGREALARIRREDGPNRTAAILAFSADAGAVGGPDFVAEGFDGEVGKPLTAAGLIGAMAAAMAAEPWAMAADGAGAAGTGSAA